MTSWLPLVASAVGGLLQGRSANRATQQQQGAISDARADQKQGANRANRVLGRGQQNALSALDSGFNRSKDMLNAGYQRGTGDIRAGYKGGINALSAAYGTQADLYRPVIDSGTNARDAYAYNLGLGDAPAGYTGFDGSPGFQFQMDQGINAIDMSAASRGGAFSGATMKAAQEYGTGLASQDFNTHMNQLRGVGQDGLQATYALGGAAANRGAGIAGLRVGRGNALAGLDVSRGSDLANMRNTYGAQQADIYNGTAANRANIFGNLGRDSANLSLEGGNVAAAGSVARGNAWSDAIQNGLGSYYRDQYMNSAAKTAAA